VQGIHVPLITPLESPGALDLPGLERLVDRLLGAGVHGLFLLGTCGEGPSLPLGVRLALVRRTCAQVGGRVPVTVCVTDPAPLESLRFARAAAQAGANAVAASTPYYFPAEPRDVLAFVELMAARTPLPLLLYNYPTLTKAAFGLDVLRRARELKNVIGVKDSSGDRAFLAELIRLDWPVMVGPESLLADGLRLGAAGGVCGAAQIDARPHLDLYAAHRAGDVEGFRRAEADLDGLLARLFRRGTSAAAVVRAQKGAMAGLGVCSGRLSPPLVEDTA
jgi:4-hydroxy-tetrahydrodipicolinate synthase